jgi:hypothetical protein
LEALGNQSVSYAGSMAPVALERTQSLRSVESNVATIQRGALTCSSMDAHYLSNLATPVR